MTEFMNVTKGFGDGIALNNFSLSVADGEKVVLMGESGIGKTTVLNIASRLIKADSGEFKADKKVAYMFQEPRLLPTFTVKQNVIAPLKSKEKNSTVDKYLKLVELDGHENKYPRELSGGMAQRAAFARFLAYADEIGAELLLLDEPFSALDEGMRNRMLEIFLEFANGKSVIYVTHNTCEAEKVSKNIIRL